MLANAHMPSPEIQNMHHFPKTPQRSGTMHTRQYFSAQSGGIYTAEGSEAAKQAADVVFTSCVVQR